MSESLHVTNSAGGVSMGGSGERAEGFRKRPARGPSMEKTPYSRPAAWPLNRNHEAARRHVNQVLRDHARPDYSRRETNIAELLDELIRERDEARTELEKRRRCLAAAQVELLREGMPSVRNRTAQRILSGGDR